MHDVSAAGSVRASQWLRREAAYMATTLLGLDAWLSRNIKKRTRNVSSWPARGSVCMGSDLSYRNMMKFGIGFTQKTAEVSNPLLVYIDLLALLYLLHAYTMCCVVTVFTLYRMLNRASRSAALPYPERPAPMRSPCMIL